MITTQWFIGDKDLADAHKVRRKVFIEEQGIDEALEIDGTDGGCIHLVVYDENGVPAATGRIVVNSGDFSVGRVAVLPEYRKKGYGTLVMQVLINACYSMGSERQYLHSQVSARGFYEKLGFTTYGEEFEDAGIPHISMEHFGDSERLCKRR